MANKIDNWDYIKEKYNAFYGECEMYADGFVQTECYKMQDTLKELVNDESIYDFYITNVKGHNCRPFWTLYITSNPFFADKNALMIKFELNFTHDGKSVICDCLVHSPNVDDGPIEMSLDDFLRKFARQTYKLKSIKY